MKCDEARRKLSDYMDGLLSAEDAALVRSHMAGCAECRSALAETERTVGHVRNLEEVEPPAWLTQKVMTRVREEAKTEKGIWRRLFHPLHIKLPLEALAAILIAATALYLYNINGGELKIAGKQSLRVGEQSAPAENKALARGAGTAKNKSRRQSGNIRKKKAAVALPQVSKTENEAAPAPEERAQSIPQREVLAPPKGVLPGPAAQAPSPAAKKNEAPAGAAAEYGGPAALAERKEEARVMRALPLKKEAATQGSAEGSSMQKAEDTLSSSRIAAEAVSFTVEVDEPVRAAGEFEKVIAELGGRIVATQQVQNGEVFTADLESQRIGELFGKLKTLGKPKEKEPPVPSRQGTIIIRIEILQRVSK